MPNLFRLAKHIQIYLLLDFIMEGEIIAIVSDCGTKPNKQPLGQQPQYLGG
jgi:hypothetical protein